MEPGPVQGTRKLCSRRYGLPGEPGALHLPSLTPADVCTFRPSLPLRGIPSAPSPGTRIQPGTQHLLQSVLSVLLSLLQPHCTMPSSLTLMFLLPGLFPLLPLFLLPGLPFFMFLPISFLLFKIQLRGHLCGTFSEATFPPAGSVALGWSHHPSPFSLSFESTLLNE